MAIGYLKVGLLTCLLTLSFVIQAEVVRLATGEWAPYQSQSLKNGGFITQVVVEAFSEQGYQVELLYMPWKRAMKEAKAGRVDGTFLWGANEERAEHFYYSDTVLTLTNVLFQRRSNPIHWSKIEDLAQYRIGGVDGYSYGIERWEELGFIKLQRVHKPELNYRKLQQGRLDLVIEDTYVGKSILEELNLTSQISINEKPINQLSYYILIPKNGAKATQLIEAFNRGLGKIRSDGRFKNYIEASNRGEYVLAPQQ